MRRMTAWPYPDERDWRFCEDHAEPPVTSMSLVMVTDCVGIGLIRPDTDRHSGHANYSLPSELKRLRPGRSLIAV
jgi:hypothetical protein